jgi:hypothetical protein
MAVYDNNLPIASDPLGILDQQLRPHVIHLLTITILLIIIFEHILLNYLKRKKMKAILSKGGNRTPQPIEPTIFPRYPRQGKYCPCHKVGFTRIFTNVNKP